MYFSKVCCVEDKVCCVEDNERMAVILERDIERGKRAWLSWHEAALKICNSGIEQMQISSSVVQIAPADVALAVRYSLHLLENKAPGTGVEVRVAPWGAVKILEGPASDPHNLTPPDVIELDPEVWLRLSCGITSWNQEKQAGNISACGERDDLSDILPL